MRITILKLKKIIENAKKAGASHQQIGMLKEELERLEETESGLLRRKNVDSTHFSSQGEYRFSVSTSPVCEDEFQDLQPKAFKAVFK